MHYLLLWDNLCYLEICNSAFIASLLSSTEDHILNIALITTWMTYGEMEWVESARYRNMMNDLFQSLVKNSGKVEEIVREGMDAFLKNIQSKDVLNEKND